MPKKSSSVLNFLISGREALLPSAAPPPRDLFVHPVVGKQPEQFSLRTTIPAPSMLEFVTQLQFMAEAVIDDPRISVDHKPGDKCVV